MLAVFENFPCRGGEPVRNLDTRLACFTCHISFAIAIPRDAVVAKSSLHCREHSSEDGACASKGGRYGLEDQE